MKSMHVLPTGLKKCYDENGRQIDCRGSGQDGEHQFDDSAKNWPNAWPRPRFISSEFGIFDDLTGLIWHAHGSLGKANATWTEALTTVGSYAQETGLPWRLPTINELESLVDASSHSPALPPKHPFSDVLQSYWSSTTSSFETDWAYVLYMVKGAVGVGYKKNSDFAFWPVLSMEIR